MKTYLTPALTMLTLLGCDPSTTTPAAEHVPSSSTTLPAPTAVPGPVASASASPNVPANDVPVSPAGAPTDAVSASNKFGLELYAHLNGGDGNIAYSPASLSVALAMTFAGAKGDTAKEMQHAMSFPSSADALHGGWASQISRWQGATDIEVSVANRLYGDQSYTFEAPFLSLTKSRYGAPLEAVDFAGDGDAQRLLINAWVKTKTKDRIVDLIPPSGVTADTRMVLVNAMYFKAAWEMPFDKSNTQEAAFAAAGGEVKVPMMSQTEHMRYAEVDGVQLAERAYKNDTFATLFVLPKAGQALSSLEKKLDAELLGSWTAALQTERVAMKLPRFKIEPKTPYELKGALQAMGMNLPFKRGEADFTAMSNPSNPEDRLHIDKVFHKAFVAMDEAGTEAAAASAVSMARAGGMPQEPKVFNADRPFLYFVRDTKTGMVMFAGRVSDPTQ